MDQPILPLNRILHTDCVHGMKQLPDDCIDLTVTSPPYGDVRTYNGPPYNFDVFKQVAEELTRITKQGGVVCWIVRNQIVKGAENCQAEREKLFFVYELSLTPYQSIIGVPTGCPPTNPNQKRYANNFDYIYVLCKGDSPENVYLNQDKRNKKAGVIKEPRQMRKPNGEKRKAFPHDHMINEWGYRTNVWDYAIGYRGTTKDYHLVGSHPSLMAEKLAEDLITSFSKTDQVVFDPFCGSGTTPKMALLNHRHFLGMEQNADYVAMAKERLIHADSHDRVERINAFLKSHASTTFLTPEDETQV
ncbi:DNA adenine methyltransferase YhdJ [Polystyrenella longa]|uniref:Methyltransferase n=1 Tax=Polystyrenella longa TaxID=2528007 RepID=A0A518CMQ8_9PLAN|nr:site-specific DNA-methyltransferase [Polystyrenella longa]QDU80512.1 DNA adenine methyltransferase YhdJ [Polystyrenella longa]